MILRKFLGTVRYVSEDSSDSVQTTEPILTKFTTNRLYAIYVYVQEIILKNYENQLKVGYSYVVKK